MIATLMSLKRSGENTIQNGSQVAGAAELSRSSTPGAASNAYKIECHNRCKATRLSTVRGDDIYYLVSLLM